MVLTDTQNNQNIEDCGNDGENIELSCTTNFNNDMINSPENNEISNVMPKKGTPRILSIEIAEGNIFAQRLDNRTIDVEERYCDNTSNFNLLDNITVDVEESYCDNTSNFNLLDNITVDVEESYCDNTSNFDLFESIDFLIIDPINESEKWEELEFYDESGQRRTVSIVAVIPDNQENSNLLVETSSNQLSLLNNNFKGESYLMKLFTIDAY